MATGGGSGSGGGGGGADPAPLTRPIVLPDTFSGEEEWVEWLDNFEACSEVNGWDDATKCKFVCIRFKGVARKALHDLEEDVRKDWALLKPCLKARFDRSTRPDLYKSEFLARRKKGDESYLELGNAIRSLAGKAYSNVAVQVRDELARDQFLRALDKADLALRVRHENPKTLDDAIRMAVEWEAIERDVKRDTSSINVVSEGACAAVGVEKNDELVGLMKDMMALMKEELESRRTSSNFSDRGRFQRPAFQAWRGRGRGRGGPSSELRCWNCQQVGHRSRDCAARTIGPCWNCRQIGHVQANCPVGNSLAKGGQQGN